MLEVYMQLLEDGHAFMDIDNMDIFYYFRIVEYRNKKEEKKTMNEYDAAGL